MVKKTPVFIDQLKQVRKLTGVSWIVHVNYDLIDMKINLDIGLNKKQRKNIASFIAAADIQSWLDEVQNGNKVRFKSVKKESTQFKVNKIYAFPSKNDMGMLLVGTNELNKINKDIIKIFTLDMPSRKGNLIPSGLLLNETASADIEYPPEESFQRILDSLLQVIAADKAFLAVYMGGEFEIKGLYKISPDKMYAKYSIVENERFHQKIQAGKGLMVDKKESKSLPRLGKYSMSNTNWMFTPIKIGKRVIGLIAYSHKEPYKKAQLKEAMNLSNHITPSVENSIIYLEAVRYLRRFALLNEIASISSTSLDSEKVMRSIKELIKRSFQANKVNILILNHSRDQLVGFQIKANDKELVLPVKSSLEGTVLVVEQAVRINDISKHKGYFARNSTILSKLAVPMRVQGNIIGVLSIEGKSRNAFSEQDEQLLSVIASQVVGIIDNIRLNTDLQYRAHNLLQINTIIQRVIGMNDIVEISEITANMMADLFGYELVMVMLLDDSMAELVAEGVAGKRADEFPQGLRYSQDLGIPGEVLKSGKSILVKNANLSKNYQPIPGWDPGSAMCVPLQDGEKIFGVINVENKIPDALSESNLLVLEALAGVLSTVMLYALRYEQLQTHVRQLEVVRQTAIDISTDLDLDVLLERVVSRVRDLVNAEGAELGLIDKENELVRVLVSDNPWNNYKGYTFPFMSGVTGRVAALGEPLVIKNYNTWSGKTSEEFQAPFTTMAGVPLLLSGEVIGTLVVQDDRPTRAFGSEEVKVLELLAPQISIFIRNARLYQELEERIDAQHLAESRLIRSAKLAAVGEMAAGVAHELNNPLTTVTGFSELVLETLQPDSPEFEDLTLVLKEARRAKEVVRRLLDFSRQSELLRVNTNINETLGEVISLVHHLATTNNVDIRVEFWDDLPMIRLDRNQIKQVFLNLIHNSIQSMLTGGDLIVHTQVSVKQEEEWVVILIQDTGTGIETEDMPKIFEPFFTTKSAEEGTGLGLSISYGIVSDHGGYIDVESKSGKGTTFTVWLPVKTKVDKEREIINV